MQSWQAGLWLRFASREGKTVLAEKRFDGPLALQKPLYPEGPGACHAIVVHPPGGIAGGDELGITLDAPRDGHVLVTTPGAGKWYRSAGPWAKQTLQFGVQGTLEWLPRETIVFDGARAALRARVELGEGARYIGWDVLCLGRTGSGERFTRGEVRLQTEVLREGKLLWTERGRIAGDGPLLRSPAGLGGRTVFGTLLAASPSVDAIALSTLREKMPDPVSITRLPGLLVARYLGDSSEEAMSLFTALWTVLRPAVAGREAVAPRIWST